MAEILRHTARQTKANPRVAFRPRLSKSKWPSLGAMLLEKEAISKALEILDDTVFYKPSHQMIFRAMVGLFEKNEAVDSITLVEGASAARADR